MGFFAKNLRSYLVRKLNEEEEEGKRNRQFRQKVTRLTAHIHGEK
jgi:hypothetical protein